MAVQRFFVWVLEKVLELQLAVVVLLASQWFLPTDSESFSSLESLSAGMAERFHTHLDDAFYVTQTFMAGEWWRYAERSYLAATYLICLHFYGTSLYALMSLLACILGRTHYLRAALLAYLASLALMSSFFVSVYDASTFRLATVLFSGGLLAVMGGVFLGKKFSATVPAKLPIPAKKRRPLELAA